MSSLLQYFVCLLLLLAACVPSKKSIKSEHGERVDILASDFVGSEFRDYQWRLTRQAESQSQLALTTGPATHFVPDRIGTYTVHLTVSDGDVIGTESITIEVSRRAAPIVAIEIEEVVQRGEPATIAVNYQGGNDKTFEGRWLIESPNGITESFVHVGDGSFAFTPGLVGVYRFELVADDLESISNTATSEFVAVDPVVELFSDDEGYTDAFAFHSGRRTIAWIDRGFSARLRLLNVESEEVKELSTQHVTGDFFVEEEEARLVYAVRPTTSDSGFGYEMFELATESTTQYFQDPGLEEESILSDWVPMGAGRFIGRLGNSLYQVDIPARTQTHLLDVNDSERSLEALAFSSAQQALYLSFFSFTEPLMRRVDGPNFDLIIGERSLTSTSTASCAPALYPIAGGQFLIRNDGFLHRTENDTSTDMQEIERIAYCVNFVYEQPVSGQTAVALHNAFHLYDQNGEFVGAQRFLLVRDGQPMDVNLLAAFLDPDGLHAYLFLKQWQGYSVARHRIY